jgi:hypothetical protein
MDAANPAANPGGATPQSKNTQDPAGERVQPAVAGFAINVPEPAAQAQQPHPGSAGLGPFQQYATNGGGA